MIHKFSIFILEGLVDYEGGQVLGAYSTKFGADAACEAYKAEVAARKHGPGNFDDYRITEHVLDAEAVA